LHDGGAHVSFGDGLSVEVPMSDVGDHYPSNDSEELRVVSGEDSDGLSVTTKPDARVDSDSEELAIAEPPPISDWINSVKPLEEQGQVLVGQLGRTSKLLDIMCA